MKKLIVSLAGAALLVPAMATSSVAAPYPVTQPTNMSISNLDNSYRVGDKMKIRAALNAQGNGDNCTGNYVLIVKRNGTVRKTSTKPGDRESVRFTYKFTRKGKHVVKVKYARGTEDPCGKSVASQATRVKR